MSIRKNTPKAKPVAKPVAKTVAKTVHSHSDLELSMSALKKQCSVCCKELAELKTELNDLRNKLADMVPANNTLDEDRLEKLIAVLKRHHGVNVPRAIKAQGI